MVSIAHNYISIIIEFILEINPEFHHSSFAKELKDDLVGSQGVNLSSNTKTKIMNRLASSSHHILDLSH
jgi:hypothetical protein